MSAQAYTAMARKHWTKWLPKKVAQLREANQLETALQMAGRLAQARLLELMQQGYRESEADEVATAEYILLNPEPGAGMAPWETAELARIEREFQALMRSIPPSS